MLSACVGEDKAAEVAKGMLLWRVGSHKTGLLPSDSCPAMKLLFSDSCCIRQQEYTIIVEDKAAVFRSIRRPSCYFPTAVVYDSCRNYKTVVNHSCCCPTAVASLAAVFRQLLWGISLSSPSFNNWFARQIYNLHLLSIVCSKNLTNWFLS